QPVRLKRKDDPYDRYQIFDSAKAAELLKAGKYELYKPHLETPGFPPADVPDGVGAPTPQALNDAEQRQTLIVQAIRSLPAEAYTIASPGRPAKPKVDAINAALGFEITA